MEMKNVLVLLVRQLVILIIVIALKLLLNGNEICRKSSGEGAARFVTCSARRGSP